MMGVLAVSAQQRRDRAIFNEAQIIKVLLRKEYVIFVKPGNMKVSFNRVFFSSAVPRHTLFPGLVFCFSYFFTLRRRSGGPILSSCVVFCVVQLSADLCAGLFHSGGSFHIRGFEPILSLLLFVSALALHSRQLDLKLRLDFLWAVQVRKCVPVFFSVCVCVCCC